MPTHTYRSPILALLILCIVVSVSAEVINDDPEAVSLYSKGKRLLREDDALGALGIFQELEARYPNSPNLDLFVFHRGKARYYLGDYTEAVAVFGYFVSRFPASSLLPYAYFYQANALYLKRDISRAVRNYLKAYQISESNRLDDLIVASLSATFQSAASLSLTEADFENIPQSKKCALIEPLAEVYIERGEIALADKLLGLCGRQVEAGRRSAVGQGNRELNIAVVLPLSGELETFGQEIYNGAVVAAEFYREQTGRPIKLTPYDSKGDALEAARIIGELGRSAATDVVIGPLTSEEAAVSSAVLSCTNLPLIAPAATQAGLTQLSGSSFQLSPNMELEGVRLAEYAYYKLNADSVAIISSTATDHLKVTRSFSDHFKKLGGKVVAIEYFRPRDIDFGAYIRDVKAMLLGQPQDSTYYITPDGDTLDMDLVPASVDCIFVPGDSKQLRQLLPQIHFYDLNGFYLGSDSWGDDAVYRLGDDITKGAVFASPFLEGRRSQEYVKLAAAYDARYGTQPQRLASLGYDAVRLVTRAVQRGDVSRSDILNFLKNVSDYDGASGTISFGEYRENIEMPLYRIELQQPILLTNDGAAVPDTTSVEP